MIFMAQPKLESQLFALQACSKASIEVGFSPGTRIRRWGLERGSRGPAPCKTATCVAANQGAARVCLAVNPEVHGGSSPGPRPVRRGKGIWQLGLLAGSAAGAATVRGGGSPAVPARSLRRREELRSCRPKRAEHGGHYRTQRCWTTTNRVWNQAVPTLEPSLSLDRPVPRPDPRLFVGAVLVPISPCACARACFLLLSMPELYLYLFLGLDLVLSSHCSGTISHFLLFPGLMPSSPCAQAWSTSLLLPVLSYP